MKNKITTFLFMGYLFIFAILHIGMNDLDISFSERRKLSSFPKLELSSDYITKVEKYLLDHFPYRDSYRNIKALYNFKVLNRLENNGISIDKDSIYKTEYPTSIASIENFINKTNKIKDLFNDSNFYMMIIPDKNYYYDNKDFLHLDYDLIYSSVNGLGVNHIDLKDILNKDDYYHTDTHWRQENILKVVEKMSGIMNFTYEEDEYVKNNFDKFYGVYYGQAAQNIKPDNLVYLTNDVIDNAEVTYLENSSLDKVYSVNKLESLDAYEVYLDGASSFIEIVNPKVKKQKELIIFRDSFGSSISPLLIKYYSKITIIDNRYISSNIFKEKIDTNKQDVLFIYSTLIVNNSSTLKG